MLAVDSVVGELRGAPRLIVRLSSLPTKRERGGGGEQFWTFGGGGGWSKAGMTYQRKFPFYFGLTEEKTVFRPFRWIRSQATGSREAQRARETRPRHGADHEFWVGNSESGGRGWVLGAGAAPCGWRVFFGSDSGSRAGVFGAGVADGDWRCRSGRGVGFADAAGAGLGVAVSIGECSHVLPWWDWESFWSRRA